MEIRYEQEHDEVVEHDIVLELGPDGQMMDRTEGDYEVRKQR